MNNSYKNYIIEYDTFFKIHELSNKKLVLFGASKLGEQALNFMKQNNIHVDYFADNGFGKIGEKLSDIDIIGIEHLTKLKKDIIIVITSSYHRNIFEQLNTLGFKSVFYINNYDEDIKNQNNNIRKFVEKYGDVISVGEKTIFTNTASLDFRQELIKQEYINIGEKCYIECNFIFEKQSGKINIGDRCSIGGATNLISINEINIGNDVIISYGCTIYDHNSHSIYWNQRKNDVLNIINDFQNESNFIKNKDWKNVKTEKVEICNKVWIGFDVVILKGVTIGEGAVIGARSVVTKDVPPYTVVAGNPATIVKKIVEGE